MPRKVIIDCDPGIDDAVALCLALFDPRLEVVAVTATAGNVDAHQSSRNVQRILELLDPPRWPRVGVARQDTATPGDRRQLNGADGLGNLDTRISELHHTRTSDKVISDEIRHAPGKITIVALGPLTNIARAISADPDLTTMIDQLIIAGGTLTANGDVSPTAEFNFHSDPLAARTMLRSPITKTLVPRDVASRLMLTLDFLDDLPDDSSRAGSIMRHVLAFLYRTYRQHLGLEGITLTKAVALVSCLNSELFESQEMAGDVEVTGELTRGMTVYDRRSPREWRNNMDVVTQFDAVEVRAAILRGIRYAAQESKPST
ncbi:MAG: nucleoside hydrolase [Planctomycetales bacterium]|nr:nucleoside hydrolase [Planctomycetales bacterium]